MKVIILNSAPTVTNVNITTNPITTDDITVNYTFNDADDDLEPINSWTIRWYRNGFNIGSYDELKTRLDAVLSGTVVATKTAAAMAEEDEVPFTPTFKSEPAPAMASVDDDDDDAMSYFEKLANE